MIIPVQRGLAPDSHAQVVGQLLKYYVRARQITREGVRALRRGSTSLARVHGVAGSRRCESSKASESEQRRQRLADVSGATIKLQLSVLRHALRLARKWGYLDQVPEIEMPKKPEGRQRYLDEAEIARLLEACRASRNPHLVTIVTVAINTGMRKAEILRLTWERVDLASARITLYDIKNGRPRGVPVNRAVYDALIALEPDGARRTGAPGGRSAPRGRRPSSARGSRAYASTTSGTPRRATCSCAGLHSARFRRSSGTGHSR
jgi:integrase